MKFLLISFLIILASCQQNGRTDLNFADMSGNAPSNDDDSLDGLEIPVFQNTAEAELNANLILVDRFYILHKFTDLFEITPNEMEPDHPQTTLYDKIKPAIFQFGHFGGGCDYYASVNAWPPLIKETGSGVRPAYQIYKLQPGIQREYWHESCWNFHGAIISYSGLPPIDWVEPIQSTTARWAVNTRICHFLTKNRIEPFLVNKMGFNLNSLPEFSEDNLKTLMNAFHPAYVPQQNEINALSQVSSLFSGVTSNASKLEMWRTATQAVCQSPFWHSP